jgi:hypothetical protein
VAFKELYVLFVGKVRNALGSGSVIEKSSFLGCLLYPRLVVSVSVEDDTSVSSYNRLDKLVKIASEISAVFKDIRISSES